MLTQGSTVQNSYDKPNSIDTDDAKRREGQADGLTRQRSLRQELPVSATQKDMMQLDRDQTGPRPYDVADYIAEMLQTLEQLARQNRLETLGIMIGMAREQAEDDSTVMQRR
jgi:hypothetical protein